MTSHSSTNTALIPDLIAGHTARSLMIIVAGSAFLTISAKIQIPFWPVPLTLQTLVVMLIGATFGARLAVTTLVLYIAQGFAGLPVFAGASAGPAYLLGPTAGFIWGWIPMAGLIGLAADRGWSSSVPKLFIITFLATAVDFAIGLSWLGALAPALGYSMSLLEAGLFPFLLGDLLKITLTALLVPAAWGALALRK